jgi:hypothetical protein
MADRSFWGGHSRPLLTYCRAEPEARLRFEERYALADPSERQYLVQGGLTTFFEPDEWYQDAQSSYFRALLDAGWSPEQIKRLGNYRRRRIDGLSRSQDGTGYFRAICSERQVRANLAGEFLNENPAYPVSFRLSRPETTRYLEHAIDYLERNAAFHVALLDDEEADRYIPPNNILIRCHEESERRASVLLQIRRTGVLPQGASPVIGVEIAHQAISLEFRFEFEGIWDSRLAEHHRGNQRLISLMKAQLSESRET